MGLKFDDLAGRSAGEPPLAKSQKSLFSFSWMRGGGDVVRILPTFYFEVMTFFLRLFALAICAVALPAQNPLAMAADPFGGTYQNEQLRLELTRKGQEYAGVILLGGQSLPVKAKATAGTLAGTFESQGQTYSFQAKRAGSQLTLTTDGATHVLGVCRR